MLSEKLKNKSIILASGSPRRSELLKGAGLEFTIDPETNFIENNEEGLAPIDVAEFMAKGKSHGFHRKLNNNEILITADTIVICPLYKSGKEKEIILGKPKDREDAIRMLELLSGVRHTVATGVCIRDNNREIAFTVLSYVWFRDLMRDEIEYYIDNYKPYDKAGSFAVQEWIGYVGISKIEGSVYNVMGLPIQRVYQELEKNFT